MRLLPQPRLLGRTAADRDRHVHGRGPGGARQAHGVARRRRGHRADQPARGFDVLAVHRRDHVAGAHAGMRRRAGAVHAGDGHAGMRGPVPVSSTETPSQPRSMRPCARSWATIG